MFSKFSLVAKVLTLNLLLVIWALTIIGWTCVEWRASAYRAKQEKTRHMVEGAHSLITAYAQQAASGKMTEAEAQKRAKEALRLLRFDQANYVWISDLNSRIVLHPAKPELEGTDQTNFRDPSGFQLFPACVTASGTSSEGAEVRYLWPKAGASEPVQKITWVRRYAPWGWVVGVGIYADDVEKEMRSAFGKVLGVGLVSLAVAFALSIYLLRTRVARPLKEAVRVLNRIAEGDLTEELESSSDDEVGQMARALNQAIWSQRTTLVQVATAADEVSRASAELAGAAGQLSAGVHTQAASVEETSTSLNELTATIRNNAAGARRAEELAQNSQRVAGQGGTVVESAMTAMANIANSSQRIAEIVDMIDDIAFQTNILALNAAVEAARVGHQGRGFAVVAGEIRSLAQRSARASKDIQELLLDSKRKVETGDRMVRRSGETFSEIAAAVAEVFQLVEQIAVASAEQANGIVEINKAVEQIGDVSQSTSAQSEEFTATAASLRGQAEQVHELVSRFRLARQ